MYEALQVIQDLRNEITNLQATRLDTSALTVTAPAVAPFAPRARLSGPDRYNGQNRERAHTFVSQMQLYTRLVHVDAGDVERVLYAGMHLTDTAYEWF